MKFHSPTHFITSSSSPIISPNLPTWTHTPIPLTKFHFQQYFILPVYLPPTLNPYVKTIYSPSWPTLVSAPHVHRHHSSQANFLLNSLISNFMSSSSYFAPLLPLFTPPLPFLHPTWSCQLWPSLSPRGGELRWNGQCQSTRLIEIYWFCPACQVNARPRFSCLFLARPS